MTVTASTYLGLKIIEDLSEEDLWGPHTNDNWRRVEECIRGAATYTVQTGVSEYTLPEQNYTGGAAHKPIILISGSQDTDLDLIVPTKPQRWAVMNATTDGGGGPYTVTIKTSLGTGVTLGHGEKADVFCDGTNVEGLFVPGDIMHGSNNLSEIVDASAAVDNLGLTGALLSSNNLSDIGDAATARGNLEIDSTLIGTLLPNSGVVAGTYNGITFDDKGRATAAQQVEAGILLYESAYSSVALNTVYTYDHGLGGAPNLSFIIWLRCNVADTGFQVGEEVPLSNDLNINTFQTSSLDLRRTTPMCWLPNSTQIKIRTPPSIWNIFNPTGGQYGNINTSRWSIRMACSRLIIS